MYNKHSSKYVCLHLGHKMRHKCVFEKISGRMIPVPIILIWSQNIYQSSAGRATTEALTAYRQTKEILKILLYLEIKISKYNNQFNRL